MNKNILDFSVSLWWLLVVVLLAAALSYVLYTRPGVPWHRKQNQVLAFLRFVALFLIGLLFLQPIMERINNDVQAPLVVVAVDNSRSLALVHDQKFLNQQVSHVRKLQAELANRHGYEVLIRNLTGSTDSLEFHADASDLSGFIDDIRQELGSQKIAALVLVSDGIYNRGISPEFKPSGFPIYTVGLGDSTVRQDVVLQNVRNNPVAYTGNDFPLEIEWTANGYNGKTAQLQVQRGGKVLAESSVRLDQGKQSNRLMLEESEPGIKHYVVTISRQKEEITYINNRWDVFMEVLDSKQRVRIAGRGPHPDMKAIGSVLAQTGNYEVVSDLTVTGREKPQEPADFDVQILFDGEQPLPGKSGLWYINSSATGAEANALGFARIVPQGTMDQATPAYNDDFSKFSFEANENTLANYPPLSVPFGDYRFNGPIEVLFYQRIGSVVTDKPLCVVYDNGNQKIALNMGAGIWRWRLQEAANEGSSTFFDEWIRKMVQYLSIKENRKQFDVRQGKEQFMEDEQVYFDVAIYNDLFEKVEGQPYTLQVTNEAGDEKKFEFVYGSGNDRARTQIFEVGSYTYEARTRWSDKQLTARGAFIVSGLQLEQLNLVADHGLLRRVSAKTGGKFFTADGWSLLQSHLQDENYPAVIRSETKKEPLINWIWILLIVGLLLSTEWGLRKYWGGY